MFEALGRFFNRGRRPLTTALTTVGGGYLALSYLQGKLNEMQESLTQTRVCTENLRRRFEQNQDDCSFTVSALIPTLGKQILERMNVERLADVLSQTRSQPRPIGTALKPPPETEERAADSEQQESNGISQTSESRIQTSTNDLPASQSSQLSTTSENLAGLLVRPDGTPLQKRSEIWTEMMIVSFSRLFTCLYGLTLLTLQTHIQLGLLGRDAYLNSIISPEGVVSEEEDIKTGLLILPERDMLDAATERRYLTFSWWYLHKGWIILADRVRNAVVEVLSTRSLKDAVSLSGVEEIFEAIREKVEFEDDGNEFSFSSILLPPSPSDEVETLIAGGMSVEDSVVNPRLRSLLDETQDFLDCPDFRCVLTNGMDRIVKLSTSNVTRNSSLNVDPVEHSVTDQLSSLSNGRFTEVQAISKDDLLRHEGKNRSVRIVEILPFVSKESHNILNSVPNEYTDTLSETRELKEFSSVVYTTFEGLEQFI